MNRTMIVITVFAALALGSANDLFGQTAPVEKVLSCEMISLARPGEGVAYKDGFTSDDYHFSAAIPTGLKAWGAAPDAPFHGFTIFLKTKSSEASCIHLTVGIHVELPEDLSNESSPEKTTNVKVGGRSGLQKVTRGLVHGVGLENVRVSLELPRTGYSNDVAITLVTPTREKGATVPIFDKFISEIRFW